MDSGNDIQIAAASHASRRATPGVRRMQITALTLLAISGAVNYVDRATLAIGNPLIRADLNLSVADMGLLLRPSSGPMPLPSFQLAAWWTVSGLAVCWAPASCCGRSPLGAPKPRFGFGLARAS